MKRIFYLFLLAIATTTSAFCGKRELPITIHNGGPQSQNLEEDRCPIRLPISVYYDSDTNIIEIWCQDDNIQAEFFVYDEDGNVEAHSPYMNVAIHLTSSGNHSLLLKGDGWEAEAEF